MHIINWQDVVWRLVLATVSGAAIGFNRGEHGRAVGLRTTLLVCLASALAMLEANLLLFTRGRPADAFAMMDVMRLPLGILSGVGFIGAGAILRQQNEFVHGVTTAATLWYVTVMGLCFGGGQLGLGVAALVLGLGVLWGLKYTERRFQQDHHAWLSVEAADGSWTPQEIEQRLAKGYVALNWSLEYAAQSQVCRLRCEVRWRGVSEAGQPPSFVEELARQPGVTRLQWEP